MRRESFQNQLRRSFIRYVMAILAVVFLLYTGGFALNFFMVVVKGSQKENRNLERALSQQLSVYDEGLVDLTEEETLQKAVTKDTGSTRLTANRQLYAFANQQTLRPYFVLMDGKMQICCSNLSAENQSIFADSAFAARMTDRMRRDSSTTLHAVCTAPLSREQACNFSFCRAIPGTDGESVGYLFFNLREESFQAVFRETASAVLLKDLYDNVVYTTLDLQKDSQDKQLSNKLTLSRETNGILAIDENYFYMATGNVMSQSLRLYTLTPLDMLFQRLGYSAGFFILFLLVVVVLVRMLTRAFTKQNAMELGELKCAVEHLEYDPRTAVLSPQCSRESQELYEQFQSLIQHNNELSQRRLQMEIKHLEDKFNPHFVYNVMETVRYQISENPESASEMLLSFAALMRYSVNYCNTKVTLETDIEYINDYLLLQKVRYNNCLRYEFDIPEELMECLVPKLLLQPIIENSITHGYQPGQVLHICVKVEKLGESLRFTVTDDGAGISEAQLEALRASFCQENQEDYKAHIGLYNIQKVIRLTYGEPYGLHIESVVGVGTTVTLNLPYEEEVQEKC